MNRSASVPGSGRAPYAEIPISDESVDLYSLLMDTWRRRWIFLGFGALGASLAAVYLLFAEPVFISTARILPNEEAASGGQFSGLAALAGISMPKPSSNEALYGEILTSKDFLDTLLVMAWSTRQDPSRKMALGEFWKVAEVGARPDSASVRREIILARLKKSILFVKSPKSGVMQLDVSTRDPVLSYEINKFLLSRLEAYNRDVKKSRAGENRKFIATNLEETRQGLKRAEDNLRGFRELNRTIASPSLMLQLERLMQEVEINRNLYLELRKQFELARIEEFKSASVINILEAPVVPVGKAAPKRKVVVVVGLFLGLFAGLVAVSLSMAWTRLKPRPAGA